MNPKVAYVLKWYPRLTETFILNEILAHEAADEGVSIFALSTPKESHFQDLLSRVRAPVTYLPEQTSTGDELWAALHNAKQMFEHKWSALFDSPPASMHLVVPAIALAREVRSGAITHLHAHFARDATAVARLAAKLTHIGYSFTAHAKDIFHETVKADDLKEKTSDATAVITVSDFNVRYLRSHFGVSSQRIHRINYGLDLKRFPYVSPESRRPTVVAVGRLVEKKGFCVLIDACARLAQNGCEFNCQIIGGGVLEHSLRSQIARLGVQDRVALLGPLSQHEVIQYVQKASILAAPCVVAPDGDRDGLPNVLIEAMALGTPCIATNVGGLPELVIHEKTGLMVEPFDVDGLALAIERLLKERALRIDLAIAARRLVESDFNIVENAARLRDVFAASRRKHPCL